VKSRKILGEIEQLTGKRLIHPAKFRIPALAHGLHLRIAEGASLAAPGAHMQASQLFRKILFPTDFSRSSEAIVDHVTGVASVFGAKVWLLNVVPSLADFHGVSENYFGPFSEAGLLAFDAERKTVERDRLQALESLQKRRFCTVLSETSVRSGGVAESIVDFAGEIHADLIMMPTRGLGLMRRYLIGSVAAKVLHDATCPVWTSPHPRELDPFRLYRRVVLASHYRGLSENILTRAAAIAEAFHAQLSVLSAVPPNDIPGDEVASRRNREMADELRKQIAAANIQASVHVMEGGAGEVVRQVAEEIEEADLIVIGRGHLEETMGQLQTHAYEIICNAPCPVITL
jgi:nucleotide-binding universal stress UspA family protein